MTEFVRKAGVIWKGDSRSGSGLISTESRALYEQPYSYATRFENSEGTNPEELIAAAHAACYSMAFASTLKKNGFTAQQIETNVECTVQSKNGGWEINHLLVHARAQIPGIDNDTFQKIAREADQGCPVSNLLRNSAQIDLKADLVVGTFRG